MSKGSKTFPTVDEALAYLRKSTLPTIITEGHDDMIVFRRMEEDMADIGVNVLPVGGRNAVLSLYDRRGEVPGRSDIAYVADKDLWVFTSIPENYNEPSVFFSDGYSIENDLFRDGEVCKLMTQTELRKFESDLKEFTKWYALSVSRKLRGLDACLDVTPHELLNSDARKQALLSTAQNEEFPSALYDECLSKYSTLLRGKSLMALALMQLSDSRRSVKHSKKSLMEQSAVRGGPIISATKSCIEEYFRNAA